MKCWFTPDAKRIITRDVKPTTKLWDASNGKPMKPFEGQGALYSPEANLLAVRGARVELNIYDDLIFVDPDDGAKLLHIKGSFLNSALSSNGRFLIAMMTEIDSPDSLRVWELERNPAKKPAPN